MEENADGDEEAGAELATVMLWASCLDRDKFQVRQTPDGVYIQPIPDVDVVQKLQDSNREIERFFNEINLSARYLYKTKVTDAGPFEQEELEAGISSARELL